MPPNKLLRTTTSFLSRARVSPPAQAICLRLGEVATTPTRASQVSRLSTASTFGRRPQLVPAYQPIFASQRGRRTIFIQTENTPNPDALKFLPNHRVLPDTVSAPFIEYLSARSTISPPYPSPLAAQLMAIDGVTAVFYGADFITITKAADANWAHIRPEVFSLITETVTAGKPLINVSEKTEGASDQDGQGGVYEDSLSYNENDSEVVGMIKELLETRIRPAIQEDGGDIEYRGFENGHVLLKLRGACRTCDSSSVTLKNGIEGMLMHYIEEVQGVTQVMDAEEEISIQEFAKFEEKLKAQKGQVPLSTTGKGSLDTVPG